MYQMGRLYTKCCTCYHVSGLPGSILSLFDCVWQHFSDASDENNSIEIENDGIVENRAAEGS